MSKYIVTHENIPRIQFQSVTTILKELNKEALIGWAADQVEKGAIKRVEEIQGHEMDLGTIMIDKHSVIEAIKDAKDNYQEVSKVAMDVGTQVHKLCEAHIKAKVASLVSPFVDMGSLPKAVANGFTAFLEWEKKNIEKWLEAESKIVHPDLGYAGTLDSIAVMKEQSKQLKKGKKILIPAGSIYEIDFKTTKKTTKMDHKTGKMKVTSSGFYPEFGLQLSAYAEARENMEGEYLFEHEYETTVDGENVTAFTNDTATYKPIKLDGMGVLRLDKITGEAEFKDYTKNRERLYISWQALLSFYYFFKNRKIDDSPWVTALKGLNEEMFKRIKAEGMAEMELKERKLLISKGE